MPYIINKTNGTKIAVIQDGTADTNSLDLTLIGKNFLGYGEAFNENFVKILENFSNTTPPSKRLTGQAWFDSANKKFKIFDGTQFKSLGIIENGTVRPSSGYNAGDLWFDKNENRLYAYTGVGTNWVIVGPLTSRSNTSGAIESIIVNNAEVEQTVIKMIVNSEDTFVSSSIDFTTKSSDQSYSLFPLVKKGITFPSSDIHGISFTPLNGGHILWGTAATSLGLVKANGTYHSADDFLLSSQLSSLSGSISVADDSGILIGQQGVLKLHIINGAAHISHVGNNTSNKLYFNITTSNKVSTNENDYFNIFYISTGSNNTGNILPNPSAASVNLGASNQKFGFGYFNSISATTINGTTFNGTTVNGTTVNGTRVNSQWVDCTTITCSVFNGPTINGNNISGDLLYEGSKRVLTSVTIAAGTGLTGGGTLSYANTLNVSLTNTGILSLSGTTYQINVSTGQNPTLSLPQAINTTATVTFKRVNADFLYDNNSRVITEASLSSYGVSSLTGTANQINVSSSAGAVTLSLPQSIATSSSPTFNGLTISTLIADANGSQISGAWTLNGGATLNATYADLAERYAADQIYEPGTVLIIGGEEEVTTTNRHGNPAQVGIVSTNPAYTLNIDAGDNDTHPYIAIAGRVPCKVVGPITKGDLLVTSSKPGYAERAFANDNPNAILARALEDFNGVDGVIEVKVV